jgi:GMP synthase (glutamine-hydrolysing)
MHEEWVADGYNELDELAIDPDGLRAERAQYSARMQEASRAAFSEWLTALDAARESDRSLSA